MRKLSSIIFFMIIVITAFPKSRLYWEDEDSVSGYLRMCLEVDTTSNYLVFGRDFQDRLPVDSLFRCSLKHIADSFFIINYSPVEQAFANARVTISEDTTLRGYTRFTIFAPKLRDEYKRYQIMPLSQTYLRMRGFGTTEFAKGCWTKLVLPSQTLNDTIEGFSFIPPLKLETPVPSFGLLAYRYYLPEPICLRNGNKSVTIELPCLTASTFRDMIIRDNIILITDRYIRWIDKTFYFSGYSSIRSLSDFYAEELKKELTESKED